MRVGVVGTGFGRRVVAPVFASTPGCSVVDVVTARSLDAVAGLCRRPDVDLVSVHSPPFLHRTHVALALAAGKHVLCDKPFGVAATDAEAMLAQAEAAGVVHAVNFEFRHDPVRRALPEAPIGEPVSLHYVHVSSAWRHRPAGAWQFDAACGGGWVGAWAAHAVDLVRWLLGETTDVGGVRRRTLGRGDAEDGVTAWVATGGGPSASFASTGAAGASLPPRITLVGSDGVAECVADRRVVLRRADGRTDELADTAGGDGTDHHLAGMRRWAEVLRDGVHDGSPVDTTFADGVACARVLDRLRALPIV